MNQESENKVERPVEHSLKAKIGRKPGINLSVKSFSLRPKRSVGPFRSLRPFKTAPKAILKGSENSED